MKWYTFLFIYCLIVATIFVFAVYGANVESCYRYVDTNGVEHTTTDTYCSSGRSQMSCDVGMKHVAVVEYEKIECESINGMGN